VLLLSDGNRAEGRLTSTEIAELLGMHVNTVRRIRKRFVLEGEQPAVDRIAICFGPASEGRARWTL
jgi:hypothetical protein